MSDFLDTLKEYFCTDLPYCLAENWVLVTILAGGAVLLYLWRKFTDKPQKEKAVDPDY